MRSRWFNIGYRLMAARHLLTCTLLGWLLVAVANGQKTEPPRRTLDFYQPATVWEEALPVGNGRMGAMVFGGIATEHIQFNEDTLWTGKPRSYVNDGAAEVLPEIRRLLMAGEQDKAESLASAHFMSTPLRQFAYQPFGDVKLTFSHVDGSVVDYHRTLDLDSAIAATTFRIAGITHTRKVFASYPDRAVVIYAAVDQPGKLTFDARLSSPQADLEFDCPSDRTVLITGRVKNRIVRDKEIQGVIRFASHLSCVRTDGHISQSESNDTLKITDATSATLVLTAGTSHVNYQDISADPTARSAQDLESVEKWSFNDLRNRHVADHQELFREVALQIGEEPKARVATDDRILQSKAAADSSLAALLFDYGRYLLIASSRPGCQPANLQGVWNQDLQPSWDSKYTTNINYEMNYWLADKCRLGECLDPYFSVLKELEKSGRETAKVHYGARGWVVHHNFDLWRGTAPINASNHGIWPTGSAWLCEPLWQRYEMTLDRRFLAEFAYPLMKGAAEFYVDTLIEDARDPNRPLISGPSNSPEQGGLVLGPTMDHQLIRSLFANTISAAKVLSIDVEFREQLAEMRSRIAPNRIGRLGQLQEWLEDVDDPKNRHRHVSHLWGLHPGREITPDTPVLFEAASQSLKMRGDDGTGWSLGWKINLWARLHDGKHAQEILNNLLTLTGSPKTDYDGGGVYSNLFDAHPPFQIDGNFGATNGICEMIMQSHRDASDGSVLIELLPALPDAWKSGRLHGIQARGGVVLSIDWSEGKLTEVSCTTTLNQPFSLRYGNATRRIELAAGESVTLNGDLK